MRPVIIANCVLLLLYCGLAGIESLSRSDGFSPDSMNYVDVARHIQAGDGIVQSALGYNQPYFEPEAAAPAPMISQGPIYPLAIAALASMGLDAPRAALAVAWLGYLATLLSAFCLARAMFDSATAWLYLAMVLSYHPLREVSTWAWSESLACVWLLAALYTTTTASLAGGRGVGSVTRFWLAGVCAGMAFATRYAFAPVVAVVWIGAALSETTTHSRRWGRVAAAAMGSLLPVGAVLIRNRMVRGQFIEPALPSIDSLGVVVADTLRGLLRWHMNVFSRDTEIALFLLLLVLSAAVLAYRRHLQPAIRSVFLSRQRTMLLLWVAGYTILLVLMKLRVDLDHIDERLILPAGLVLLLPWTALLLMAIPALRRWSAVICLGTLLLLVGGQILDGPAMSTRSGGARRSLRTDWVAGHARPTDFLIGNSMEEVAFWLGTRPMATVSPYPSSRYLRYEDLLRIVDSRDSDLDRALLVLRDGACSADDWGACYGPFLGGLAQSPAAYQRLRLLERGEGFLAWEIRGGP